jgi:hypothetical protein
MTTARSHLCTHAEKHLEGLRLSDFYDWIANLSDDDCEYHLAWIESLEDMGPYFTNDE